MDPEPRLIDVALPADPLGVVIVLHGGAARGSAVPVSPTQLSVLRMIPIATRVARAGAQQLAVFRLLNARRGWDTEHTPVQDLEWAMGQVRERFGGQLPTCLIGHSLGGRAALLSAGSAGVRSVVALAPWVYPDDAQQVDATGRRILFVHGDRDRIAKLASARAMATAMSQTADVGFVTIAGGKHAMLRHGYRYERLASDFAVATLLPQPGRDGQEAPPGRGVGDDTVGRILAGESAIEI